MAPKRKIKSRIPGSAEFTKTSTTIGGVAIINKSAASGSSLKRRRDNLVNEPVIQKKKTKVSHSSHSSSVGVCLTVGEGDVGQLGLGPDIFERGRCALVELPTTCKQVVAGGMHTACLTSDGKVYTFGCNDEGALGRDTSEEDSETVPALMTGLDQAVAQISAGDSHTALLTVSGEIYACGSFRDANGSIGLTTAGPAKTLTKLSDNGQTFLKIVSGCDHIVALRSDGAVFTCGSAEQGQLGRVAEIFSTRGGRKGLSYLLNLAQVKFRTTKKGHPRVVDVWAGTYLTFVKSSEGTIYSWGLNNYYQLGLADMENKFVPTLVTSLSSEDDWISIAGGQHHTVLANAKGEVFTVGRGTYGQLGLGEDNVDDHHVPTRIESLNEKCFSVSASSSVSFAISNAGIAYAWGMGTSKQLGNGVEDDEFLPRKMTGKQLENKQVRMISAGGQHTVVLAA